MPKKKYYRLEQLENEDQLETPLVDGVVIRGEVANQIIISVPVEMTHASLQELITKLPKDWHNKVIITTNNIKFMRVQEVTKMQAHKGIASA